MCIFPEGVSPLCAGVTSGSIIRQLAERWFGVIHTLTRSEAESTTAGSNEAKRQKLAGGLDLLVLNKDKGAFGVKSEGTDT